MWGVHCPLFRLKWKMDFFLWFYAFLSIFCVENYEKQIFKRIPSTERSILNVSSPMS